MVKTNSSLTTAYRYVRESRLAGLFDRAGQRARQVWHSFDVTTVPGLLTVIPTVIKRLGIRSVEGKDFVPVKLDELMHLRESMAPVLEPFGLELIDVQAHDFQSPLREAGPISSLKGIIAPKMMAQNAVAALTVSINGAETGSAKNFKKVKTWIDGIGATITHKALTITGEILAKFGYHLVTVATEGTPTHSKPGESAIGSPTITIGTRYPANAPLAKEPVDKSGKVFTYQGVQPVFIGMDVVEGTEIASTSLAAYQQISGRDGNKDNGAACVISAYDTAAVLADTYANKVIVIPAIAKALKTAGLRLSLEDCLEETFAKIARATGREISDLSVMGLGLKPRLDAKAESPKFKNERPGRQALLDKLDQLGVKKVLTFDDGETPAVGVMVKNTAVEFANGERGTVDIMIGPGGVFETVTAARTVADACETGCGGYAAVWGYASKDLSKKPATYFQMGEIPEAELRTYHELGIDPEGTRSISQTLPDAGDRLFIVSSITSNPKLNPFAIAPEIDADKNTVTVYQEVVTSDGQVSGRYFTFRATAGLASLRKVVSPIVPDIMKIEDLGELRQALQAIKADPVAMEALRTNLRMYLYSLVGDTNDPDKPSFYLYMNQLLLRRHFNTPDDQKALAVLRFAADEHPEWFVNQQSLVDSKRIIQSGGFTVEKDAAGNATAIKPNDPSVLRSPV